ncbi:MAG: LapA family protein [Gammaproteobacteria bacterium]
MARFLLFIFFLALTLLFFIFTLENLDFVSLNLVIDRYQVPLGLTMLICFVLGSLVGVLFSVSLILKNKNKARVLAKKVAVAEQEVANLRQLPIKSSH